MNSTGPDRTVTTDGYEIRLQGHLAPRWSTLLEDMTITHDRDTTVLRGPVVDQAALHGLLTRIRDIGMPLLSIVRIESGTTHPARRPEPPDRPEQPTASHPCDPPTGERP